MALGSFLGGCELWISTSENMSSKPLSISVCQRIDGPGEWLVIARNFTTKNEAQRGVQRAASYRSHPCFWNLHKDSLAHAIALNPHWI